MPKAMDKPTFNNKIIGGNISNRRGGATALISLRTFEGEIWPAPADGNFSGGLKQPAAGIFRSLTGFKISKKINHSELAAINSGVVKLKSPFLYKKGRDKKIRVQTVGRLNYSPHFYCRTWQSKSQPDRLPDVSPFLAEYLNIEQTCFCF